MKKETKILIFLFLLAPTIGELITGSAPPLVFFNPVIFSIMALLYGLGAIIIREVKVRWNLQWSVVLLAVAYGIIEEGIMLQSFFNVGWEDLGELAGYGLFFGIQIPWAIMLTLSHATVSILIPIAIVGLLWPEYKNKPFLKKRGIIFGLILFSLTTIIGMIFFARVYDSTPGLLLLTFIIVFLLIWLSYIFRKNRIGSTKAVPSPIIFGLAGFFFMLFNSLAIPFFFPRMFSAGLMILAQLIFITLALLFMRKIYNANTNARHISALVIGALMFWIILSFLYGIGLGDNEDPTNGMSIVAVVGLALLIIWRKKVLAKASQES